MKSCRIGIAVLACVVGIGVVTWAYVPGDLVVIPNPFPAGSEPPEGAIIDCDFTSTEPYIEFVVYDEGFYGIQSAPNLLGNGGSKKGSRRNGTSLSDFGTIFTPMLYLDHFMPWLS